jgi:hypothetical protein
MGVLDALVILGSLAVLTLALIRRRGARPLTAPAPVDAPAWLLVRAIAVLPAGRADWGRAMAGELEQIRPRSQRWRFAAGCLAATMLLPPRPTRSDRLLLVLVGGSAVAGAALVAGCLVRYPAVLASPGARPALAAFGAVLAGCTLGAVLLVRRGAPTGPAFVGGPATAAVWIVFGYLAVTYGTAHPVVSWLLLALPSAPLIVGVLATRRGRTGSTARRAALLAAVVAGLLLFLALAAGTLLTAGGPYDAGQLRDFPGSRFPDIASYAVNDNLGTAMSVFLLVSIVAAALGCLAATVAARLRSAAPTP